MPAEIMSMLEFALPDHTRFSLVDFPLHLPFELLGLELALKVLVAVMLEFKVVIPFLKVYSITAGGYPVEKLQRSEYVRPLHRAPPLPVGIHVPCHPTASCLHAIC